MLNASFCQEAQYGCELSSIRALGGLASARGAKFLGLASRASRNQGERTKGCLSRSSLLELIFKLAMCAEKSFKRLCGFEYLAEVIASVRFAEGACQERMSKSRDRVPADRRLIRSPYT